MKEVKATGLPVTLDSNPDLNVSYDKISNIKKLFEIVDSLKNALENKDNEDTLRTIFEGLVAYAEYHFSAEEQIMRSFEYGGYASHKKEHTIFYEKAKYFNEVFSTDKSIGKEAVAFLQDWLNEHVQVSDKKIGNFLLERRKANLKNKDDKKKIGLLLLQKGLINRDNLDAALAKQEELKKGGTLKLLGTILIDMNFITSDKMIKFIRNNNIKLPIGELLLIDKKITEDDLVRAKEIQQKNPTKKIASILIDDLKVVSENDVVTLLAKQSQMSRVTPDISDVDPEFLFFYKKEWLMEVQVVPYRKIDEENGSFICQLIVPDPEMDGIAKIESIIGGGIIKTYNEQPANKGKPPIERKNITFEHSLATLNEIKEFIITAYDNKEALLFSRRFKVDVNDSMQVMPIGKNYYSTNSNLNIFIKILTKALDVGASDVHIEPLSDRLQVRFRTDGVLVRQPDLPKTLNNVFVRGLKNYLRFKDSHLQNVIVDDRKSVFYTDKSMSVDLRISILPTMYGDTMVIRLLLQNKDVPTFEQLGMCKNIMQKYNLLCSSSSGIIIVTGPTGSGKTTTLFSTIDSLNEEDIKIMTLEDPPEYQIHGVTQVTVSSDGKRQVKYIDALKSALRQDPDIIMFGEMRDYESSSVALNAALTGHLLFSTLHTNDAASTITRLFEIGISSFLLSSTLVCVVAQRLLRVNCPYCKEETEIKERTKNYFRIHITDFDELLKSEKFKFYKGEGCDKCAGTGFKGRMAIHELLCANKEIRQCILDKGTSTDIENVARKYGMTSMLEDGFFKAAHGITTLEEVNRVAKTFGMPQIRRSYYEIEHLLVGDLTRDEIIRSVYSS